MNNRKHGSLTAMVLLLAILVLAVGPALPQTQSEDARQVLTSRPAWRDLPPALLDLLAGRLKTAEKANEFAEIYERSGFLDRQKNGFSADSADGLDFAAGIIATSLTNYGNEMGGQQNFQEAKRLAELAILIRPRHIAAWQSLAMSFYFLADCKSAVAWSEKALEFKPDPNSPDAWERQLANDPGAAEQRRQAESYLRKIIEDCGGKK